MFFFKLREKSQKHAHLHISLLCSTIWSKSKKRREPKNQIFEQAPHDVSWKPDSSGNLQAQFLIYEFVIMIKWEVKHGG